jgi:outer membrane protein assembly factor BamD (BamD/ComL family)
MRRWSGIGFAIAWLLLAADAAAGDGGPPPAADGAAAAAQLYHRARDAARAGRTDQALQLLCEIDARWPRTSFADEALAERARLWEQRLERPDRALALWRELIERFPDGRPSRRARARIAYLERHLDGGPALLARYQKLKRQALEMEPARAAERIEALLAEAPGFSLRAEGILYAAGLWRRAGQPARARALLEALAADPPDRRAAGLALSGLAHMARDAGKLDVAERAYQRMAALGGDWERTAEEGRQLLAASRRKSNLRWTALAIWAVALLGGCAALGRQLARGRLAWRQLWPPPLEAVVYLVAMGGLLALVWGRATEATMALAWMTGLFAPCLLVGGWLQRSRPARLGGALAFALGGVLLGLVCTYAAVDLAGMVDQVLHTLRYGVN